MHSQAALAFDIMLFFFFHAFLHRRAFCFYLLSNSLFLSATDAFSVIYYICLLYASSYPLCYSMYPPPTEPNRYRIVESSSCLRVLKGLARFERLVFIGCYLYYIYHTHTYTHTHMHTQYGHAVKVSATALQTCTNASNTCRTSLRCCTAQLGTGLRELLLQSALVA